MSDWVETEIRVRYAETDMMGVAHHSNYFVWFEAGRAAYCRAKGIDYLQMEKNGLFLPVAEASCRFKRPVGYDDLITIRVRVSDVKRSLARFQYRILNQANGELVAEGETVQALIGRDGRMKTFPAELVEKFGE